MVDVGDGQPKSTSGKKKTTAVEAKSSSVGSQAGMFPYTAFNINQFLLAERYEEAVVEV
jgi:hypothetical protein